jgi:hypothetical protein
MNTLNRFSSDSTPYDAGTLWTLRHADKRARCALLAWPAGWELRVIVDGRTFLSQRCQRGAPAFALAEAWKQRMVDQEWTPILPAGFTSDACVDATATSAAGRSRGSKRR